MGRQQEAGEDAGMAAAQRGQLTVRPKGQSAWRRPEESPQLLREDTCVVLSNPAEYSSPVWPANSRCGSLDSQVTLTTLALIFRSCAPALGLANPLQSKVIITLTAFLRGLFSHGVDALRDSYHLLVQDYVALTVPKLPRARFSPQLVGSEWKGDLILDTP